MNPIINIACDTLLWQVCLLHHFSLASPEILLRPKWIHLLCANTLKVAPADGNRFCANCQYSLSIDVNCLTTRSNCALPSKRRCPRSESLTKFLWAPPHCISTHVELANVHAVHFIVRCAVKIDKFPSSFDAHRTDSNESNEINLNSKTVFLLFIFKPPQGKSLWKNKIEISPNDDEEKNPLKVNRFFALCIVPQSVNRTTFSTHKYREMEWLDSIYPFRRVAERWTVDRKHTHQKKKKKKKLSAFIP